MKENKLTLVFPMSNGRVLLGMKKRGFGKGYWNGFGGKIEDGEDKIQAMLRECKEEANIVPVAFKRVAKLNFFNSRSLESPHHNFVYVYTCQEWEGEPKETEEMKPEWFNISNLPYAKMWPPDRIWLPRILSGELLKGEIFLDENNNLASQELKTVTEL